MAYSVSAHKKIKRYVFRLVADICMDTIHYALAYASDTFLVNQF